MIDFSRRQALTLIGGPLVTAALPGAAAARPRPPVGVQLYVLSEQLHADLRSTLRRLREIGYRTVELSELYGRTPAELRAELDDAGLQCTSVHLLAAEPSVAGAPSLTDVPAGAALARSLGATNVVCPTIPFRLGPGLTLGSPAFLDHLSREARSKSVGDWRRMALELNRLGMAYAAEGLRLGYHNHNLELGRLPGGERPLDVLMHETDPALVSFELDIGWVMAAGLDPVDLLKRGEGRITQVHLKDIAPTPPNVALKLQTAELGAGVGDWTAIFAELRRQPAIRYVYVEQEPPLPAPALAAVERAFAFVDSRWR